MVERIQPPLYNLQSSHPGGWSWRVHFRLPDLQPRQTVLNTLHEATQALKFFPAIPLEQVAAKGLSGMLKGPDEDAKMVSEIIFAQDPSQRYGLRESPEIDRYVVRIAELNDWTEICEGDGEEDDPMRTILGRGKGQYGGEDAFTVAEAQGLLDGESPLYFNGGGYIFSDRPGWEKPYGEPGIIVEADGAAAQDFSQKTQIVQALSQLAWDLDRQDRWVLEMESGTEVYKINPAAI